MRTRANGPKFVRRSLAAISFLMASPVVGAPAMAFDTAQLGQGGSLAMQDIMPLIRQSPELLREATEAAAMVGKKLDDIGCGGMRFSGSWNQLSGYRVSPYVCAFGDDRFLEIRATVRVSSRGGRIFKKATPEALRNASHFRETKPTWRWLSEDPRRKDH